jgi:hypothetical protein
MADLIYITDADVFGRFGGEKYLAQCLDNDNDGVYDQDRLTLAKKDACEKIAAACGVQIDVQAAYQSGNIPQYMVTMAAQEAVYYCWQYGTEGQACPKFVITQHEENDRELDRIRRRERTIGAPEKYPSSAQALEKVNADPCRRRFTVRNFSAPNGFR